MILIWKMIEVVFYTMFRMFHFNFSFKNSLHSNLTTYELVSKEQLHISKEPFRSAGVVLSVGKFSRYQKIAKGQLASFLIISAAQNRYACESLLSFYEKYVIYWNDRKIKAILKKQMLLIER